MTISNRLKWTRDRKKNKIAKDKTNVPHFLVSRVKTKTDFNTGTCSIHRDLKL